MEWNGTMYTILPLCIYTFALQKTCNTTQHNSLIVPFFFVVVVSFLITSLSYSGVLFFLFFFYIFYILLFAHAVDAVKEATIVGVLLGLVALGVLTLFLMHHCCHKKKPKLRSNDIEQATETSIELQKNPMNNSSD